MTFLLDTNVVSETVRPRPEPRVAAWFGGISDRDLHVSVLTLGEIWKGIELLDRGPRRERLQYWLETKLPAWLEDRVLPVNKAVAERWGRMRAQSAKTTPVIDSLIAATAIHHNLRLVTRNDRDFAHFPGLVTVNPWEM